MSEIGGARGLVVAAVVEELRDALGTDGIGGRFTSRGETLGGTVVVLELQLRDAGLLAQALKTRPATSRMTLKVGTVRADGSREFGPRRVVAVSSGSGPPGVGNPCAYPPCRCPRHRPDLHADVEALQAPPRTEQ